MELEEAIGLQMQGFGVVGGQEEEGLVEAVGVAGKGKRQVGEVVGVYLRLVRSCSNQQYVLGGDVCGDRCV